MRVCLTIFTQAKKRLIMQSLFKRLLGRKLAVRGNKLFLIVTLVFRASFLVFSRSVADREQGCPLPCRASFKPQSRFFIVNKSCGNL